MKTTLALASLAIAGASAAVIPNEFIVRLKPNTPKSAVYRHMVDNGLTPDMIIDEWNINNDFVGYAVRGSENVRLMLQESADVLSVTPNEEVHALQAQCASEINPRSWGLRRISNSGRTPTTAPHRYDPDGGNGHVAFILDTGIRSTHVDFEGRTTSNCFSAVAGETCNNDGNGHGTHVAGTVGGNQYGVAKQVSLTDVKVLSRSGSGSFAGVISGVNWTAQNCNSAVCVANMSLGGGRSNDVNNAVQAAARAGVLMVLASGNSNTNACNSSPASAGGINGGDGVVSVNSATSADARSSFSNFGECTDVYAPGSSITSAWHTSDTASNTISGTSMAAPHVAGVAAIFLSEADDDNRPYTSAAQLRRDLISDALPDLISNAGTNTPNLSAFIECN